MTFAAIESGPDAGSRLALQLQSGGGQPVAWTIQPVEAADHRSLLAQTEQIAAPPDVLILLSDELAPLARVLNQLPAALAVLVPRPEWIQGAVYWPGMRAGTSSLPSPGEELLATLRSADCRVAFGELPTTEPDLLPELAPRRGSPDVVRTAIAHAKLPEGPNGVALRAGFFQIHDFLDDSHECSQSIEGMGTNRNGDYWHAIMHRREPDAGNSKYWFRRVGQHPVFPELTAWLKAQPALAEIAPSLCKSGRWEPSEFVDFCEAVRSQPASPRKSFAERIQLVEMILLLESTARDAGELLPAGLQAKPHV